MSAELRKTMKKLEREMTKKTGICDKVFKTLKPSEARGEGVSECFSNFCNDEHRDEIPETLEWLNHRDVSLTLASCFNKITDVNTGATVCNREDVASFMFVSPEFIENDFKTSRDLRLQFMMNDGSTRIVTVELCYIDGKNLEKALKSFLRKQKVGRRVGAEPSAAIPKKLDNKAFNYIDYAADDLAIIKNQSLALAGTLPEFCAVRTFTETDVYEETGDGSEKHKWTFWPETDLMVVNADVIDHVSGNRMVLCALIDSKAFNELKADGVTEDDRFYVNVEHLKFISLDGKAEKVDDDVDHNGTSEREAEPSKLSSFESLVDAALAMVVERSCVVYDGSIGSEKQKCIVRFEAGDRVIVTRLDRPSGRCKVHCQTTGMEGWVNWSALRPHLVHGDDSTPLDLKNNVLYDKLTGNALKVLGHGLIMNNRLMLEGQNPANIPLSSMSNFTTKQPDEPKVENMSVQQPPQKADDGVVQQSTSQEPVQQPQMTTAKASLDEDYASVCRSAPSQVPSSSFVVSLFGSSYLVHQTARESGWANCEVFLVGRHKALLFGLREGASTPFLKFDVDQTNCQTQAASEVNAIIGRLMLLENMAPASGVLKLAELERIVDQVFDLKEITRYEDVMVTSALLRYIDRYRENIVHVIRCMNEQTGHVDGAPTRSFMLTMSAWLTNFPPVADQPFGITDHEGFFSTKPTIHTLLMINQVAAEHRCSRLSTQAAKNKQALDEAFRHLGIDEKRAGIASAVKALNSTNVDKTTNEETMTTTTTTSNSSSKDEHNGITGASSNEQQKESLTKRVLAQAQADAVDAAWRTSASQFVKLARDPLVALISRHLSPDDESFRVRLALFLQTEVGASLIASVLSIGLSAVPLAGNMQAPAHRLARELRVKAMADIGELVMEIVMGPLRQVMSLYIQDIPVQYPALGPSPEQHVSRGRTDASSSNDAREHEGKDIQQLRDELALALSSLQGATSRAEQDRDIAAAVLVPR